jgi:hypothetical protein
VVVIGVTDEKLDVVDRWIKRRNPTYPIVVTKDRSFEKALGVRFFPTGAVLDPEGVILYAGSVGGMGKPLEAAAKLSDKKPFFPKSLKKVRKYLGAFDLEGAYKELDRIAGKRKVDEETAAWVSQFRAYIDGRVQSQFDSAKQQAERGLIHSAVSLAEPLAEAERLPLSTEVAAWLVELESRVDYKAALKAGPHWDKAQGLEDEREFVDAIKAYRVVLKRYGGTPIGELALNRVAAIIEAGMPGFRESCSACRAVDRACEKHHEKVKI